MIRVVKLARPLYGLAAPSFSYALRDAARLIPGVTWSRSARAWAGYPDAIDAVAAVLRSQSIPVDTKALPKPGVYGEPLIPVAEKGLREYQKVGVRFLLNQGPTGALLADFMGGGKSAQATIAARALQAKTLILCPSHVRGVWSHFDPSKGHPLAGQLQKWWPAAAIVCAPEGTKAYTPVAPVKTPCLKCLCCISGLTAECPYRRIRFRPKEHDGRYPSVMRATNAVVLHYDIVHAWVDVLIRWGVRTIILDEAHAALQNARSRRSQAIRRLIPHATATFALTGTPPAEKPRDFWNLIDTISPGRLGHFFNYGLRHCEGHREEVTKDKIVWQFDGRSNLEELAARAKYFVLRRTKEEVALELPPMTRQIIDVEIPAKKRVRVNMATLHSKKMMREVLNLAADGKLNPALELIRGHADEGHHVVVFTLRRAIAEYVTNATSAWGIPSDVIMGGVLESKRRDRIAKARLAKNHVMACTIDATSTGIDLSYADVAVFVELTWEPHKLAQAEARLNRFGQQRPVLIQYVIARGTGDELIRDAVVRKLDTFETVIGTTGDGLKGDLEGEDDSKGLEALAERLKQMQLEED